MMGMVALVLRWSDSAAGGVQSGVVVPVDPFQSGQLDLGEGAPRPFAVDLLGLEESDRGLGQRVVVTIADAADRRVDAGLDEPAGEGKAGVLRAGVVVADHALGERDALTLAAP